MPVADCAAISSAFCLKCIVPGAWERVHHRGSIHMDHETVPNAKRTIVFVLFSMLLAVCLATAVFAQMGGNGGHHHGDGSGNGNGNGNHNGNHNGTGHGGGHENGNMGRRMGGVMLVSGGNPYRSDGTIIRMEDAQAIAERYMNSLNSTDLLLDEIEEWEFNYFVVVKESAPPQYKAFQLLIDKWTGAVMPEPGPNMMWNQKYAGRGGMMDHHGQGNQWTQPMAITEAEARADAVDFLHHRFPAYPNAAVSSIDTFYGFYSLDVTDTGSGVKLGMLSVNGQTGQVWYHTWHGAFIQEMEIP